MQGPFHVPSACLLYLSLSLSLARASSRRGKLKGDAESAHSHVVPSVVDIGLFFCFLFSLTRGAARCKTAGKGGRLIVFLRIALKDAVEPLSSPRGII